MSYDGIMTGNTNVKMSKAIFLTAFIPISICDTDEFPV